MADKHYVGEYGTVITVDCGSDITGATNLILKVRKPNGTEVEWVATIYNSNYLRYTVVVDDFDQVGTYHLQASLTLVGWNGPGETTEFEIYDEYK